MFVDIYIIIAETPHRPKIWGAGAGSNVVGIICLLVGIGLTDLPKTGGGGGGPPPASLHIEHLYA